MRRSAFIVVTAAALALAAAAGPPVVGPATANAAAPQTSQQLAPEIVRDIQRSLNSKGYHTGSVDGVFGRGTQAAIAAFQRDNSLPGAGQVDQRTLAALGITGVAGRSDSALAAEPPGQALSPDMVHDVQGELRRLGYDVGRIDGVWGERTRRALLEFQRDRNLAATGRIDRDTLAALEAGGVTQTGELPQQPVGPRR